MAKDPSERTNVRTPFIPLFYFLDPYKQSRAHQEIHSLRFFFLAILCPWMYCYLQYKRGGHIDDPFQFYRSFLHGSSSCNFFTRTTNRATVFLLRFCIPPQGTFFVGTPLTSFLPGTVFFWQKINKVH